MKKFTGWVIIIICSVFLLFFMFFIVGIILTLERWSFTQMTFKEVISTLVGFSVVIVLLIVGLMNGIKRIKNDKIKIIADTCTLDINLTGRIAYKDYRNLCLELSFRKPVYIVFVCLLILFSLSYVNTGSEFGKTYLNIIMFLFLGVLVSPILILLQVKKNYRTNRIFQEQLNYELTTDSIRMKGETVDSIQKWTGFYKVKETKSFFMLYQGEGVATLLDKKMFTDNELANFKQFIRSLNFYR